MPRKSLESKTVFTTQDVARLLLVDVGTIINWVDQHKIVAYRTPGAHRRIQKTDLLAFLRAYQMPVPEALLSEPE